MEMLIPFLISVILVDLSVISANNHGQPKIRLSNSNIDIWGTLKHTVDNLTVWQFLGIPYAQGPVGDNRFRPAVSKKLSEGTDFNATHYGDICMQNINAIPEFKSWLLEQKIGMSEDCLSLNIWVPAGFNRSHDPLPVMVFFHGGAYLFGSASDFLYDGKVFAALGQIILVSVNYRLNVFGFLFAGTDEAPGNLGIRDQQLALKWVQNNIASFGGDPRRVTIFGHSAGGASVAYHLINSKSRSYFQRAIMQSGSGQNPWAFHDPPFAIKLAMKMGLNVNCTSENISNVINCLKSKPAHILVKHLPAKLGVLEFGWTPVVDGDFLIESPFNSIENGDFKKTDLLIGSTTNEAAFFLQRAFGIFQDLTNPEPIVTRDQFIEYFNMTLAKKYTQVYDEVLKHYKEQYLDKENMTYTEVLVQMITDMLITCDLQRMALKASNDKNFQVYNYVFSYKDRKNARWAHVPHVRELFFLFGSTFNQNLEHSDEERELTRKLVKMWSNFAKFGTPGYDFLPYKPKEKLYLSIDMPNDQIGHAYREETCEFLHLLTVQA